ncbi:DHHC palmitoyltransferase-domain-containing protein [Cercophora newfieldiana]|uniref:Palmitoyltransferase PFA4 n=1 Tax=Cercophora newfieldiana TaxID=92897 RepID=A0AA39YSH3_9PEZI|nr:DHHC palmitoyltransferase-domain-containing protein [Cercophora newfieldiana]
MSGPKTGPARQGLQVFAVPLVCVLISFLGYFSQWLFNSSPDLGPGPFTSRQSAIFNGLLICVWYTYYKACTVDPGRYVNWSAPKSSSRPSSPEPKSSPPPPTPAAAPGASGTRWCKKCDAPKPPRAHHCRHCGRCIPKMDHHCPWTGNCVSMQTFPYFLRFLVYTNIALWALAYHVFQRLSTVWSDRRLPAYLGPSLPHLIAITILSLVNFATALALGILLVTTIKSWALNTTMIEDWEIERHESVLSRLDASTSSESSTSDFWGADGDSGVLLQHLNRIEFPYDLGIFSNLSQAMGTSNPISWFFPLAGGPRIDPSTPGKGPGWEWEENGFNDLPSLWPPPDPEKLRRAQSGWPGAASRMRAEQDPFYADQSQYGTAEDTKAAFAARQQADQERRQRQQRQRWEVLNELEEVDGEREYEGEVAWTNGEGDTLWDYGVDEEVERDDGREQQLIPLDGDEGDDDVPIAELIRRRKVLVREEDE